MKTTLEEKDIDRATLEASEELKTFTRIKEIILWLLISIAGGFGLGVLICFLK